MKPAVFQFDSGTYDGNLSQAASKLEQSTSFQAQQATSWVNLKASDEDRILRYSAQTGVNGGYDPQTKTLTLNANAEASLDLFDASITSSATFPSDTGYHFVIKPDGQDSLDLGYFKAELDLTLYENSGASIVACGNVTVAPNPNYQPTPPDSEQPKTSDTSGNLIKGRLADSSGTQGDLGFFAGVSAGCNLDGKFFWKNPESVTPVQNPSAKSEALGSLQGQGQATWQELADLGVGVEGDAGAGAQAEFKITYYEGRFVISCHAKVVWGAGAGGKIQIVIDGEHILEFIQFVFHQIKNYNFNYTNLIDNTAFGNLNFVLISSLWDADTLINDYAKSGFDKAYNWFVHSIQPIMDHNQICANIIQLANSINNNQQQVKYLPPEAKGRLLYKLSQYFKLFGSPDPAPAQAMMKILSYIQSANEWIQIMQNIVDTDPNNMGQTISAIDGQSTLLNHLQINDIQSILTLENSVMAEENALLIQNQQALNAAYQQIKDAYNINLHNAVINGHFEVVAAICAVGNALRPYALQNQAVNQLILNYETMNQLVQVTQYQENAKIYQQFMLTH